MAEPYILTIKSADITKWESTRKAPSTYVVVHHLVPPKTAKTQIGKTKTVKEQLKPTFNDYSVILKAKSSDLVWLQLYRDRLLLLDKPVGEHEVEISKLLELCGSKGVATLDLKDKGEQTGTLSVSLSLSSPGLAVAQVAKAAPERLESESHINKLADTLEQRTSEEAELISSIGAVLHSLETVIKVGDAVAEFHPYAQTAWSVLKLVHKVVKEQKERDEKLLELVYTMAEVYSFVKELDFLDKKNERLQTTVLEIAKETLECALFIQEYTGHGFAGRVFRQTWSDTNETIDRLTKALEGLKDSFDRGVACQAIFLSGTLLGKVEMMIQSSTLEHLKPVEYDGSELKECLPGTRIEILAHITSWLATPPDIQLTASEMHSNNQNILWMQGVAGAGKSTISTTVSQHFRNITRLGAYLFFQRDKSAGTNASSVIHTIAYTLAKSNPGIRIALSAAITGDITLITAPIRTQFEKLVLGPLIAAQSQVIGPIIIILDALDECGTPESRHSLVSLIATEFQKLPPVYRFLITSRPDSDIARKFRGKSHITELRLDITTLSTKQDIVEYFRQTLEDIRQESQIQLEPLWPGEAVIQRLTVSSGGLFIWASTACKFIRSSRFEVNKQLATVLAPEYEEGRRLDDLYRVALQSSVNWEEEGLRQIALAVLGAVLVARTPLNNEHIDKLLDLGKIRSSYVLEDLGCVVQWSPGQPAHTLHTSFHDYLTDRKRSGNKPWFVDSKIHNKSLALGCLQVLNRDLQFNICHLQDSHILNAQIDKLPDRIREHISPTLSYASQFWAIHLQKADPRSDELLPELRNFISNHFLYWLEILSLLTQVSSGTHSIKIAYQYAQTRDASLGDLLQDALRFLGVFSPVIAQSVPHIYISAIPFSPYESLVRKQFAPLIPHTLHMDGPLTDKWPSLRKVIVQTSKPFCLAYSPNGNLIASGSEHGTLHVWDSETGTLMTGPLKGHSASLSSLAFSGDSQQIVSGSNDNTVIIWDSVTGDIVAGPLTGHTDSVSHVAFNGDQIVSGSRGMVCIWDSNTGDLVAGPFKCSDTFSSHQLAINGNHMVYVPVQSINIWNFRTGLVSATRTPFVNKSVTFSPDGTRIATVSYQMTSALLIHVWDSETGEMVTGPFGGHPFHINCVAWSPDGKMIASGSITILIHDSETGILMGGPFEGDNSVVRSVSFSPDGKQIVSGSDDGKIWIWDCENVTIGPGKHNPLHLHEVSSVAYSPDGTQIVSGSWDKTVCVWDSRTGEIVSGPFMYNKPVRCVAFSPDGTQAVSGYNRVVCVWDVNSGEIIAGPFEGHTNETLSVAFSPDGTQLASGSGDQTVRLWDSKTGAIVSGPFQGHTGAVNSVAFSPSGSQVLSGSDDKTIRVWDPKTGSLVAGPLEGHTGPVLSVAFSLDGTRIVSGSEDQTMHVWDATSWEMALTVGPSLGHSAAIKSVAFSPDGTRLVSGSQDRTVRVWDSETGAMTAGPFWHTGQVPSVAFSPDGREVLSGSWDETIRVWELSSPHKFAHNAQFEDGWLLDSASNHILWVPPWLREELSFPWNSLIIASTGKPKLKLAHFVHGKEWQKSVDPKLSAPK